ncbi:uncharacterized protein BDV17DRAFT_268550 [Aspergillus undulatus]|uniref:uncharacterized protein n=1 Tax=Aspergillus undulatus TaxID=1810928 RepID=UPI003CCDD879
MPLGTGVVAITKPSWMWKLNHVAGLAMDGPIQRTDIGTIETIFANVGIAPYISLSELAHPDARGLLVERGYTVLGEQAVYVLPLDTYEATEGEDVNEKCIEIRPVSDD